MALSEVRSLFSKLRPREKRQRDSCYEPFTRDRQIRLVKITSDVSKPYGINLALTVVDLVNAPPFFALSYTWGRPELDPTKDPPEDKKETTYSIRCNQGQVTIHENLFRFLQRICKSDAQDIPYWIDALCINQADLDERSSQVAFMGDIYMAASRVFVWLGPTDPHPDALWVSNVFCVSFVNMITHLVAQHGNSGTHDLLRQVSPTFVHPTITKHLGEEVCQRWQRCWPTFFEFIATRQWFCRGWVIQEVVLKHTNLVHVLSGDQELNWMAMMTFIQAFTRLGWHRELGKENWRENQYFHLAIRATQSFFDIEYPLNYGQVGGRKPIVAKTLPSFSHNLGDVSGAQSWYVLVSFFADAMSRVEVTDPRDHIYAWLGLALLAIPDGMDNPIVPDYSLSTEKIFTRFTGILLENTSLLFPLYKIEDPSRRRLSQLPSWVPDYSTMGDFRKHRLMEIDTTLFEDPPKSRGPAGFDASRTGLFQRYRPSVAGTTLTLYGVQVDRITGSGVDLEEASFMSSALDFCIDTDPEAPIYPLTQEHRAEAIMRTLVANTFPSTVEEPDQVGALRDWILHYCLYLLFRLPKDGDDPVLHRRLCEQLKTISKSPQLQAYLPTFEEADGGSESQSDQWRYRPMSLPVAIFCGDRALYQTEKGLIGLGPKSLTGGDEVWLLTGSKVPFILRRGLNKAEHYIVGEAYLHAGMHGELMTDEAIKSIKPVRCV